MIYLESIQTLSHNRVLVTFRNGVQKLYDCTPLLAEEPFDRLQDEVFFKTVQVDAGGYGISWRDEVDLSESELWLHGKEVDVGASSVVHTEAM